MTIFKLIRVTASESPYSMTKDKPEMLLCLKNWGLFVCCFFIEVPLVYNVMLVSGIQPSVQLYLCVCAHACLVTQSSRTLLWFSVLYSRALFIFYILYMCISFISVISTLSNHPLPLFLSLLLSPIPYSIPLSCCLTHGEHSRHLDFFLYCTPLLTLSLSLLSLAFTPSHQKRGCSSLPWPILPPICSTSSSSSSSETFLHHSLSCLWTFPSSLLT